MRSQDVKKESSVPVQARVSINTLAELDMYWREHGRIVPTMSRLIAWSLDLFREYLDHNGHLPMQIDSVAEAHNYLQQRGLYQSITKKRGFKKIVAAMGFEALRAEGLNPKQHMSRTHGIVHNINPVEPSPQVTRIAELGEIIEQTKREGLREDTEEEKAERNKKIDALLAHANRNKGIKEGMSEEELNKYDQEREGDILAKENAPIDISGMEFADEPDDK